MNRSAAAQLALGVLLIAVLTRMLAMSEPLPGWDGDPLAAESAITGIGPAGYLVLDVITALAGCTLIAVTRRPPGWVICLAVVAAGAVMLRTMLFDLGDAEPLPALGAWISGSMAFAAAACVAARPALREFAVSVVIGAMCLLLAKGAGQLLVEHPAVVRSFELNPEAALAARDFEPGSPGAQQFERRLRQPDITAWFGLANVLAAFLASAAAAGVALCWSRRSRWRSKFWLLAAAFTCACAVGVIATGSKAGMAVLILAALTLAAGELGGRRLGTIAGIGLWGLPVAAIIARAAAGPEFGELSLLFRSFYLETAAGIAAEHAPWGTGVDGFRSAYAASKPEIATETVTSAHNAIADWLAMLGVAGIPLVCLAVAAVIFAAGGLGDRRRRSDSEALHRPIVLAIGLVLALPVAASAVLEAEATPIELALFRLVGLVAACVVASGVFALRPPKLASAIMCVVLLTHAQVDMVLFQPGAIPFAMLAMGLAVRPGARLPGARGVCVGAGMVVALGLAVVAWRAIAWERPLREAFEAAQRVVQMDAAQQWRLPGREGSPERASWLDEADAGLERAAAAMPRDPRALLSLADLRLSAKNDPSGSLQAARAAVEIERSTRTLGRLGVVALASAGVGADAAVDEPLVDEARRAWTLAADLDPNGAHFPSLLAQLERRYGDADDAARWAAEALLRDDRAWLDPLARLPEGRRRMLEELVKPGRSGS